MNPYILIAEDDLSLGYTLSEYLKINDYKVALTNNGQKAFDVFRKGTFDLCLFDIMMPEVDGFTLAKKVRQLNDQVPIIFLTAKAEKIDKLRAFNIGADDFIVKPVDGEELVARIKAILRRTAYKSTLVKPKNKIYEIGMYLFNYSNQLLKSNQTERSLTYKESEILKALCDAEGSVLNRNVVLNNLWGEEDYFSRKSMDVFIYKLRKYLSEDQNVTIRNIHGKGFILMIGR